MINFKKICLLVYVVGCFTHTYGADKYTDENRPYEFGFTIEGEQHRHEKKDENGIIMGEFGFITADGVYHVTVYATDENGNFKILSMKNIRVKPYPTASGIDVRRSMPVSPKSQGSYQQAHSNTPSKELSVPNTSSRQGHSIEFSKSQQGPSQQSLNKEEVQHENNAGPARACSHCSVPTTTTPAPKLPPPVSTRNQFKQNNYGQSQVQPFANIGQNTPTDYQTSSDVGQFKPQAPVPQGNYQQSSNVGQYSSQAPESPENYQQNSAMGQFNSQVPISPENYQQNSAVGQHNLQAPVLQENYQQQSAAGINNAQIADGERNYQQLSNGEGTYQRNIGVGQNNPQAPGLLGNYQQNTAIGQNNLQTPGSQGNYGQNPAAGLNNPQLPNVQGNHQQYSDFDGAYQVNSGAGQNNQQKSQIGGEYEPNSGNRQSYDQGSGVNQTPVSREQQSISQNSLSGSRNPKSFKDILQSAIPDQQYNSVGEPQSSVGLSKKPVLIAAQMQIVDKNTDIYHKNPGEDAGLPKGLNSNDISQLLYTFNYTVGFHGHHEEGYLNGVKQGYYYVTARNGIRTRVDYIADEKGFHPRISQEVLDISSDDVPKPETEKDEKYGLKGYEFKWLYYPVEAKRR